MAEHIMRKLFAQKICCDQGKKIQTTAGKMLQRV